MHPLLLLRVLGWEAQHINKLANSLSRSITFGHERWSKEPHEFAAQLIEAMHEPGFYDDFEEFIVSPQFDPRNREQKQARKNRFKYSVLARWVDRVFTLLEQNPKGSSAHSAAQRWAQTMEDHAAGDTEALVHRLIDQLFRIEGGEDYIEFGEWLIGLEREAIDLDEQIENENLTQVGYKNLAVPPLLSLAHRADIRKAYALEIPSVERGREEIARAVEALKGIQSIENFEDLIPAYQLLGGIVVGLGALSLTLLEQDWIRGFAFLTILSGMDESQDRVSVLTEPLKRVGTDPDLNATALYLNALCELAEQCVFGASALVSLDQRLNGFIQERRYADLASISDQAQSAKVQFDRDQQCVREAVSDLRKGEACVSEEAKVFFLAVAEGVSTVQPPDLLARRARIDDSALPVRVRKLRQTAPGHGGSDETAVAVDTGGASIEKRNSARILATSDQTNLTPLAPALPIPSAGAIERDQRGGAQADELHALNAQDKALGAPECGRLPESAARPDASNASAVVLATGDSAEDEPVSDAAAVPVASANAMCELNTTVLTDPEVTAAGLDGDEFVTAANPPQVETGLLSVAPQGVDTDTLAGFFNACNQDRFDLAFWLSWCAHREDPTAWNHDLTTAFVHGVSTGPGEVMSLEMRSALERLGSSDVALDSLPERLFLVGAMLGPVVFCEDKNEAMYGVSGLLHTGLACLDSLLDQAVDLGLNKQTHLTSMDAAQAGAVVNLKRMLEQLAEESKLELQRVRTVKMAFYPGEVLLHSLYREGMDLAKVHGIVADNDPARISELRSLIESLDVETLPDRYDLATTLDMRPPKMIGPVRVRFLNYLRSSVDLGYRWIDASTRAAQGENSFRTRAIEEFRGYVQLYGESVLRELAEHGNGAPIALRAALHAARHAVKTFSAALFGHCQPQKQDLHAELLAQPEVVLDDDFNPVREAGAALHRLLESNALPDPGAAFDACLARCEFARAKTLLEEFKLSDDRLDALQEAFHRSITVLHQRCEDLEPLVEDAYLLGELSDLGPRSTETHVSAGSVLARTGTASRSDILGKLIAARQELEEVVNAPVPRVLSIIERLEEVEQFAQEFRSRSRQKMEVLSDEIARRFPATAEGREDAALFLQHLNASLAGEDQVAAAEIIHQAEQAIRSSSRLVLMNTARCETLRSFEAAEPQLQAAIDLMRNARETFIGRLQTEPHFFGLDLSAVPEEGRIAILRTLDLLQRFRESSTNDPSLTAVPALLSDLGFEIKPEGAKVRTRTSDYRIVDLELRYTPVCPLPAFGTNLRQKLTVLVLCRRYGEEELRGLVTQAGLRRDPVLVLPLFAVSMQWRLKLRALNAAAQSEIVVLDPVLLLFVLSRQNRLQSFFEASLPYAYSQPYLLKGENVPEEIFVGREKEVNSLIDQEGGCIVFGGRQLGKSATLRHLVFKFHSPRDRQFVLYRDIDDLGAGADTYEHVRYDLWASIAQELTFAGISDLKMLPGRGQYRAIETLVTRTIREYLNAYGSARIVLLLDEADDLINLDAQYDFGLIKTIRALMVDTRRRFKVVFAGLQSVQQYQKWSNHPFAQLGAEVVICPLPPDAAQRLVVGPFRALGFEFESPELVLRILSTVNYHPGLTQIFCHRLLARFYDKLGRQRKGDTAVRVITREDLREVERDRNLVEDIRNRFGWTISLDDRYAIVIYALVMSGDPTEPRTEEDFLALANQWWPSEFSSLDVSGMRSVLDELEGLGVLVRSETSGPRLYQLRSPNLLRLMGTRDTIEQEMLRLISQKSRRKANPREFHHFIGGRTPHFSPFTMGQEAELFARPEALQITFVFGSQALGLHRVEEAIVRAARSSGEGADAWVTATLSESVQSDPERFALEAAQKLRQRDRRHISIVASLDALTSAHPPGRVLETIAAQVARTCTKASKGRIYLVGGPGTLWSWLAERRNAVAGLQLPDSELLLQPWSDGAVWKGLEAAGLKTRAKQLSTDMFEESNGFHFLLEPTIVACKLADLQGADELVPELHSLRNGLPPALLREKLGFEDLPVGLKEACCTFLPVAFEHMSNGHYVIRDKEVVAIVGELPAADYEIAFGQIRREEAAETLTQWMIHMGIIRPADDDKGAYTVATLVTRQCFQL